MKTSKNISFAIGLLFIFSFGIIKAQTTEISADQVPNEVKAVLNQYINILTNSNNLDVCANEMLKIAAGGLLSQDCKSIASDVKPYSLKKDFENVKFYKNPVVITRVQLINDDYDGYGPTLISGTVYKIWIAKKEGVNGMPAPVKIIVPKNHPTYKTPKVISNIGSL